MRKNKLISPSSKPLLKVKNPNISKNKLQLATSLNSLQKSSFNSSTQNEKMFPSPRSFPVNKKVSFYGTKSSDVSGNRHFSQKDRNTTNHRLIWVCENKSLMQNLGPYGVKSQSQFICIGPKASELKDIKNLSNIIILSTLQEFTSIYVSLITSMSIEVSNDKNVVRQNIRWFIVCDAINSKTIEGNFKQTYKNVHFVFLNSTFALVNLINLTIRNVICWETSKDKFQLSSINGYSQTNLSITKQSFEEIIHLSLCKNGQSKQSQKDLVGGLLCIRQKQLKKETSQWQSLSPNTLYICNKKQYQQFIQLKDKQNIQLPHSKSENKPVIYVNYLQKIDPKISSNQLLKVLLNQQTYIFLHLTDNFHQEFCHTSSIKDLYTIVEKENKLIYQIQNSFNQLFTEDKSVEKCNTLTFNSRQIFKIMINFKSSSPYPTQIVFLIINKSYSSSLQNYIGSSQFLTQNQKLVPLILNDDIEPTNFIDAFKSLCHKFTIPLPLFFIIKRSSEINLKIQFEQINFHDTFDIPKLKTQISRKLQLKRVFSGSSLKQLSKKIAIYGLQSDTINRQNTFISELCYFLNLDIKIITEKQIVFSPSLYPIKDTMEQTKNKINILFGKINTENQKNLIFRSFLVIYLPKMQKISMQKLLTTLTKAYEKYFYLIDSQGSQTNNSHLELSLYIFSIPNLQLTQKAQLQTVKHFRLNQFQECLKNIVQRSRSKRSIKRSFYIIFQMEQFQEEFEAMIDNARMKNDCEIEIYLKYGEQFIHRPKNGKYKFIKSNELRSQIQSLIQNFKDNQMTSELLATQKEQKETIEEINKMINSQSVIQQSPRKIDSFVITPVKGQQKSTYSAQNSLIQSMIQENDQDLNESLNSINYLKTLVQAKHQASRFHCQTKLYIFVHKTLPLKCLINRNQADYQVLTYNTPNQPLLMAPYLEQNEIVIVLKKKSQKTITQFMKSVQTSKKSHKGSSNNQQKVTQNLKIIQLKQMSQKQVTNIIDSLINRLKLKKIQSQKSNKFINEIPFIIYECPTNQNMGITNRLKKIRSLVSFQTQNGPKSKDIIIKTPKKQIKHFTKFNNSNHTSQEQLSSQYFFRSPGKKLKRQSNINGTQKSQKDEQSSQNIFSLSLSKNDVSEEYFSKKSSKFKQPNQTDSNNESYEDFLMKFKSQAPSCAKYFPTISQKDFMKIMRNNSRKLSKICEQMGIKFYYFGGKQGYQNMKAQSKSENLIFDSIQSLKQLLLKYFDPYIKVLDKGSSTSRFKLSVSMSLILYRLIEQERQKKKIPQRLWNMSSRSKKTLSSTSIKVGSASKVKNLASSNASSSSSLRINGDREDFIQQRPLKPDPVLNYYYSKQLIKQRPLKTHMDLFYVVGSSGIKDLMRKEKTSFKKVKVNEYFTCVEELMTILWENGQKKYFLIVLMTKQEVQDLAANTFFVSQTGLNLENVIILEAKQTVSDQQGNQTVEFLTLLLKMDQKIGSCVLKRELKFFEQTIEEIQTKIQYFVADMIEGENLLERTGFDQMLKQQISMQQEQLLNKRSNQISAKNNQHICAIICFIEDFEYLKPLIDSIVYKQQSQKCIRLVLQKTHSIEQAINLNTRLMIPRCLVIPSEWWYFKIVNGIMIDYNLEHFERKLAIFLNNIINQFVRKDKFSFGKGKFSV